MENIELNHDNFKSFDNNDSKDITNEKASKTASFSNVDFLDNDAKLNIKVIGVGGAGCNIINKLKNNINTSAATLYAFDTDAWSLKKLEGINNLFIIDKKNLKGYGSNSNALSAKQGIINDQEVIKNELKDTDILFLVSGLGKSTASGALPEITKIAHDLNILTVSVVSMPSITCEGQEAYNIAFSSLEEIKRFSTSITTISNERIVANNPNINFIDLYKKSNKEFCLIISKIIDMITYSNEMNIDYSDLRSFFLTNRFFMFNNCIIKDKNIDLDYLSDVIISTINNNISDVNVQDSKHIIGKFDLHNDVNNDFLSNFKQSCYKAVGNNNVKIQYGIDLNHKDEIELTYLIGGNNSLPDLNTEINELLNEEPVEQHIVNDKTVEIDHYSDLLSELESALTPTKELKTARIKDKNQSIPDEDKKEENKNDWNDIG